MREPMTMPAMAPPERWEPAGAAVEFDEAEDVGAVVEVFVGKSVGIEEIEGSVTPEQRVVTPEASQHESVALGELVAQ